MTPKPSSDWRHAFLSSVIGQSAALERIIPYIDVYRAGLARSDRPIGIFLLLGPTGTGKTHTVEMLAEAIHGYKRNLLRIDCGEYQMDHEVCKLIGAPPGYLGHRETQPLLSQQRLHAAASERSDITVVLFDEIEKAAPSLMRLLLGVLDRATLRLGDNSTVSFDRSLIFLTSNLGAVRMREELSPTLGFRADRPIPGRAKLESIGTTAARKRFSPEFMNRIDEIIAYEPLSSASIAAIMNRRLVELEAHIAGRLGYGIHMTYTPGARHWLLKIGNSPEHGAREMCRVIERELTHAISQIVLAGMIGAGDHLRVAFIKGRIKTHAIKAARAA